MNPNKDPVMRRTLGNMSELIFDKIYDRRSKRENNELSQDEKKAVDRCTQKYLETSCYVKNTFDYANEYLMQVAAAQYQQSLEQENAKNQK